MDTLPVAEHSWLMKSKHGETREHLTPSCLVLDISLPGLIPLVAGANISISEI
jgi:hypothetical protein